MPLRVVVLRSRAFSSFCAFSRAPACRQLVREAATSLRSSVENARPFPEHEDAEHLADMPETGRACRHRAGGT
jgi:hypothetical protein